MTTPPEQLELPLFWELRSDIRIVPDSAGDSSRWVVKDPLRLTYFLISDAELTVLKSLDGRRTLNELLRRLGDDAPNVVFSAENLRQFVSSAIANGILRSTVPGLSLRLAESRRAAAVRPVWKQVLSVLTFRLRGFDPTRLLNRLDSAFGWVYSRHMLRVASLFVILSGVVAATRWSQLRTEVPSITSLLTQDNLPILIGTIVLIKVLHEIGHGLTCRHFGGECHELGLVVVGFVPLLYCNVSDSWLLNDKFRRVLVAFAGIGVELLIAGICTMVWAVTRAGLLHTMCLNAIIACSINTLLVNGNPLLRYDGYFILSDLIAIPNLSEESKRTVADIGDRLILGLPGRRMAECSAPTAAFLAVFGVLSLAYRYAMLIALMWLIYQTLLLRNLAFAFYPVLLAALISAGLTAATSVLRRCRRIRSTPHLAPRAVAGLLIAAAILGAILLVPIPWSLRVPFVIESGECQPIFAPEDGILIPTADYGSQLRRGEEVAVLINPEIEQAVIRTEGELAVAEVRQANLSAQRTGNPEAANALPLHAEILESCRTRLEVHKARKASLQLLSPADGIVFPPRNRPAVQADLVQFRSWTGLPLSPENSRVPVARQTVLGWVGHPRHFRASCLVPQSDIDLIEPTAFVTLTFLSNPGVCLEGSVKSIRSVPELTVPRELVTRNLITVNRRNAQEPSETSFVVEVEMTHESEGCGPRLYSSGFADIRCVPKPLVHRIWRFACRTLTFLN